MKRVPAEASHPRNMDSRTVSPELRGRGTPSRALQGGHGNLRARGDSASSVQVLWGTLVSNGGREAEQAGCRSTTHFNYGTLSFHFIH